MGLGNARRKGLREISQLYFVHIMTVLSSTASVEEESSDSVPLGGNRLRALFKRPEFMIRGPQERSSSVYAEVGLVKGPESRAEQRESKKR